VTGNSQVRDVRSHAVIDSGYLGRPGVIQQDIYWLDNERIVFVGAKPGEYTEQNRGVRFPNYGLYVWDTNARVVKLHHEGSLYSSACVFQRYVWFEFDRSGSRYIFEGLFGKETLRRLEKEAIEERSRHERVLNRYTCREYKRSVLPPLGYRVEPLLEGEYVSRERESRGKEIVHWTYWPRKGSPMLLNMTSEAIGIERYAEYLDSYVLREYPRAVVFSDTVIRRWWLMNRQGEIRDFSPPTGPWMRGSTYVTPTKKGLFLISHAVASRGGNGAAGGYLMGSTGLYRVIEGRPESFDVSPDGCRVAISISDHGREGPIVRRIQMLNLCSNGG
jgi:hypothetical protein